MANNRNTSNIDRIVGEFEETIVRRMKFWGRMLLYASVAFVYYIWHGANEIAQDQRRQQAQAQPIQRTYVPYTPPVQGSTTLPDPGPPMTSSLVPPPTSGSGHAGIGVRLEPVNAQNARLLGFPQRVGAYVADVVQGSPAEAAMIRKGDFFIEIDGKLIDGPDFLTNYDASKSPGDTVVVTVVRFRDEQGRNDMWKAHIKLAPIP